MTCRACKVRVLNHDDWATPPRCAFPNSGPFDPDNWNCATANQIREICGDDPEQAHSAVDWRAWNARADNGDQKYATIELPELDEIKVEEHGVNAMALWVTWYKRRGRTDEMWLLFDEGSPRRPTEVECGAIIRALRAMAGQTAA